jgi:hypothetical protein
VSTHGETDLAVHLEAAVGREQHNVGRLERITWREDDAAVVHPSVKVGLRRTPNGEVPLKQVVVQRCCAHLVTAQPLELAHLAHDTLHRWTVRVVLASAHTLWIWRWRGVGGVV